MLQDAIEVVLLLVLDRLLLLRRQGGLGLHMALLFWDSMQTHQIGDLGGVGGINGYSGMTQVPSHIAEPEILNL